MSSSKPSGLAYNVKTHASVGWLQHPHAQHRNFPFYVYTIDRSVAPFNQAREANLSNAEERAEALNAFVGPVVPASRILGNQDGIYVAPESSLLFSRDTIQGTNRNRALLLVDCQELCLQEPACTAIAFPGCYLLKKEVIQPHPESETTSVYVKEKRQPEIKPVSGYSEADSFLPRATRARESFLNKPFSCAVDSKGDLLISDGLNQRIRKVQGYNTDCSTSELFLSTQVQDCAVGHAEPARRWQDHMKIPSR